MKILMLINPSSRGGRGIKLLPRLRRELDKAGIDRTEVILSSIDEARERAFFCDTALYDAVAAVGGDGTIRAVGEGVLSHPDPELKMGVLYTGTSPDFCHHHRIPLAPDKAAAVLKEGYVKQVPVLTVNGVPFFCSCNPGMGAEIAEKANRLRPFLGDFPGTLAAVVTTLRRNPVYDFKVNGELLEKCNHLLITRMPYIASSLKLALPPLKDDEYCLWYLQNTSSFQWIKVLLSLYLKRPCGVLKRISGETAIESPACSVPLEYDGDPRGELPGVIRFAPRKLNLLVPSGETSP